MYNNGTFEYVSSFANNFDKIVNLQWEQIFTNADDTVETLYNVKGIAKEAVHICWGPATVKRLTNYGVPKKNIKLTGHISLDFIRKEFRGYYQSRERICDKYNIPHAKRIHLFVSSFSYVGMPKKTLESDLYQSIGIDPNEFVDVSIISQGIILEWFCSVLKDNTSDIIIYRPHPAEVDNVILKRMSKEHSNFFVISDESVKQWIVVSDRIYTWYSTSIAEVLSAGKDCVVLRPYEISHPMDMPLYEGAHTVKTIDEFVKVFQSHEKYESISRETLNYYYHVDEHESSYMKICTVMEQVIHGSEYSISLGMQKNEAISPFARVRILIKRIMLGMLGLLYRFSIGKLILRLMGQRIVEIAEVYNFNRSLYLKNKTTNREIKMIQKRIMSTLDRVQR